MDNKKLIAFYLPQYYEFEENNLWWGKGFTEWTNVKKAKPLYKGHTQPTIPLDNRYYNLSDINVMKWQVEIAKNHGIYGFCFYHYWFGDNSLLMEKPVENYLKEKSVDFPYCLCWANHNWTRTWTGGDKEILKEVKYDAENELEKHFDYLLPFFQDSRYIKISNKPVFLIYMPELIPNLTIMKAHFDTMAKEFGFNGIIFISQAPRVAMQRYNYQEAVDYSVLYEPNYTQQEVLKKIKDKHLFAAIMESPSLVYSIANNALRKRINNLFFGGRKEKMKTDYFSYDGIWKVILKRRIKDDKLIPGCFVGFDNSPRKGYAGMIYRKQTIEKFKKYFEQFINKKEICDIDLRFIMAWNEWGEGAYLEPDETYGYGFLEAINTSLNDKA